MYVESAAARLFQEQTVIVSDAEKPVVTLSEHVSSHLDIRVFIANEEMHSQEQLLPVIRRLEKAILRNGDFSEVGSTGEKGYCRIPEVASTGWKGMSSVLIGLLKREVGEGPASVLQRRIESVPRNALTQRRQHTEVTILNAEGDADITFIYHIVNTGYAPLTSRCHQYWFSTPQQQVEFHGVSSRGPLNIKVTSIEDSRRELVVEFPDPLEPLERFEYSISYRVKAEFVASYKQFFYYVGPRVATQVLCLKVNVPSCFQFNNASVSYETPDGFLSDEAPFLQFADREHVRSFSWTVRDPKPGSLYRTFWEYPPPQETWVPTPSPFPKKPILTLACKRDEE